MSRTSSFRLVAALILGWSLIASAAPRMMTGKIHSINVGPNGFVRITMVDNVPLCTTPVPNTPNNIGEFLVTTIAGQGMLATFNAAKLSGRSIDLWTDNGAPAYGCNVIGVTLL